MGLLNNKRGVSPLIATVLLIAFAVALGAVVMNWGRGYAEDLQDNAKETSDAAVICTSDVHPEVVQVDRVDQVCFEIDSPSSGVNNISLIVQNSPRRDIERFEVQIIGTDSKVPVNLDLGNASYLANGDSILISMTYNNTDLGNVSFLKLTPVISHGGGEVKCKSNSLKFENLRLCSEVWD